MFEATDVWVFLATVRGVDGQGEDVEHMITVDSGVGILIDFSE